MERAAPPDAITPEDFFTRWVPAAVSADPSRRERLASTQASIEFVLAGTESEAGGVFEVSMQSGEVVGRVGHASDPALCVHLDLDTWRSLNRGDLQAPEAVLRRRLKLEGDFLLGLKLHLILN